jgi:hypothetical protein
MEILTGILVVVILVWLIGKLKKVNQNLNDHYPFDPR